MTEAEARLLLQACRPGEIDRGEPEIAEALNLTSVNPEMARWFAEEQDFDRAIAAHLDAIPAPFGLKTRILAQGKEPARRAPTRWIFGLAAIVCLLFLLVQVADYWRAPKQNLTADYTREMTSFISLAPPLKMESGDLGQIKNWIAQQDATPVQVPTRLAALQPVGCRVLSFRGHEVTLICFRREGKRLAHLFTVDRAAMPGMKPGEKPVFANEHGWMTATWAENTRVYMITMQGSRAELEQYLPSA